MLGPGRDIKLTPALLCVTGARPEALDFPHTPNFFLVKICQYPNRTKQTFFSKKSLHKHCLHFSTSFIRSKRHFYNILLALLFFMHNR